jgi:hypothetical protein
MSAARGTTLRSGEFGLGGNYISRLLAHDRAANAATDEAHRAQLDDTRATAMPATAEAHARTVWTMRPPAAHSSAVHAFTGDAV